MSAAVIEQPRDENHKQNDNDVTSPKTTYPKSENIRITRNVVVIGLAFMIHFTAFWGTSNLQSTINSDGALGSTTLAIIYGSLILSNIFLPVNIIRLFGCKWTIALSFIAYMPFQIAQFAPSFATFIPSALGVGLGGGPVWCAKCTYLAVAADAVASIVGNEGRVKSEVVVVKFFGLFFVFYQMAQVWGNLISWSVLSYTTDSENATTTSINETVIMEQVRNLCGAKFCPGVSSTINPNLIPPEPSKIQMLNVIFVICMVVACMLVIFGVDSLQRYGVSRRGAGNGVSGLKLLAVTLGLLKERYQLLLLPITMFIGAEEAFVAVDFTASFVACGWGISRIGFAMICYGVFNALASGIAGALAKVTGRVPIMVAVYLLHGSLLVYMHEWTAVANDYFAYCLMAALWGICDGIWLVNVNAFSGILFPGKEIAAFSNFRLWESTGSVIGYAISSVFCTSTKLRWLMSLMTVGMVGYGVIEFMEHKAKGRLDRRNLELVNQTSRL
ncbi:hypothetical protein ACFFRR_008509 [Megaselia abdita]